MNSPLALFADYKTTVQFAEFKNSWETQPDAEHELKSPVIQINGWGSTTNLKLKEEGRVGLHVTAHFNNGFPFGLMNSQVLHKLFGSEAT